MDELTRKLAESHARFNSGLPGMDEAKSYIKMVLAFLIPHFAPPEGRPGGNAEDYKKRFVDIENALQKLLSPLKKDLPAAEAEIVKNFSQKLGAVYDNMMLDAEAILLGDPAAESIDEVILAYPGFLATAVHRLAHEFYLLKVPLVPRLMSEYVHRISGIDIHPGAQIGRSFCLDHGTGTVIGETTVIGEKVKMYQGVTLGALSVEKSLADKKRHPTIEDNVVIYSNATILGGDTVIGKNSVIGGNVWITASVPENSLVYHSGDSKIKQN